VLVPPPSMPTTTPGLPRATHSPWNSLSAIESAMCPLALAWLPARFYLPPWSTTPLAPGHRSPLRLALIYAQ